MSPVPPLQVDDYGQVFHMDYQFSSQVYDQLGIPDRRLIEDWIRTTGCPPDFFESYFSSTFQSPPVFPHSLFDSFESSDQAATPSSTYSSDSSDIASTWCLPVTGDTTFYDAIVGSSEVGQQKPLQFSSTPVDGLFNADAATTTLPKHPKPSRRSNQTKKHVCKYCMKLFPRPRELNDHLLSGSHLGIKPFGCEDPQCQKQFSTRSNARRHFKKIHKHRRDDLEQFHFKPPIVFQQDHVGPTTLEWLPPATTDPSTLPKDSGLNANEIIYAQTNDLSWLNDVLASPFMRNLDLHTKLLTTGSWL